VAIRSGAVAAVCAVAFTFSASAVASPLSFSMCSSHQELVPTAGVQCASLRVPEVPEDPGVGTISLAVQRVPATGTQLGTIVFLSGGPGEAALPGFEGLLAPLAKRPALRGYELVSFDQRGTGQSGALSCPALFKQGLSALAACGESLGGARTDYTSQDSVDDLHALRVALGGPPLSLFAVSYGTKVAGMYALEYPQEVARMVLDSPVPIAGWDGLSSQRTRALPRVLDDELCGDGVCGSFAPNPEADLDTVVDRLHAHPVRARMLNTHGHREAVTVTETELYELVVYMDLSSDLAGLVPGVIADAAHGHWQPLARLVSELPSELPTAASVQEESNDLLSLPLLASTLCTETPLPWAPESAVASRTATLDSWLAALPPNYTAPFAPLTTATQAGIGFCKQWPPTPPAPPLPTGTSSTPTLILSGDEDLRTPYEEDLTVATGYTSAQILRIPDAGHSTVTSDRTGCAKAAMISFLTGQPAPASCPGMSTDQTVPPPASSLGTVRPAGSRSTLAGRGAVAVADTLREILGQPTFTGAGLAGGSWEVTHAGLRLKSVSDIPGVAISGHLSLAKVPLSGSFTVSGRAAGKLTLNHDTLSGRLAGSAVRLHLAL
jgi:pimeloyl-ACP methyl ester carboxylesterase